MHILRTMSSTQKSIRISRVHRALSSTIQLLIADRIAPEFSIDKIFGVPNATHFGCATDIGTHRLNDEADENAHIDQHQDDGQHEGSMHDAVNEDQSHTGFDEVD